MKPNPQFWRSLRADFESLQQYRFSLVWSSRAPRDHGVKQADSRWTWWEYPDASIRTRLSEFATRGATALGGVSEDDWYDRLRTSPYVRPSLNGATATLHKDGALITSIEETVADVVKHSITLCILLERDESATAERPVTPTARNRTDARWNWFKPHMRKLGAATEAESLKMLQRNARISDQRTVSDYFGGARDWSDDTRQKVARALGCDWKDIPK